MQETYLKHLTVVVIGIGTTIMAAMQPDTINQAYILYGVILGYVFKNGAAARRK